MKILLQCNAKTIKIDYDQEADVLYISFDQQEIIENNEVISKNIDDILLRYKQDTLIGITILNFSKR